MLWPLTGATICYLSSEALALTKSIAITTKQSNSSRMRRRNGLENGSSALTGTKNFACHSYALQTFQDVNVAIPECAQVVSGKHLDVLLPEPTSLYQVTPKKTMRSPLYS